MAVLKRSSGTERDRKWASIWFTQLAAFHRRKGEPGWQFTADDVIAFSRSKLKTGMPAWKRLKMVHGLMSRHEVEKVLGELHGVPLVIAQLLYGCGMRISEALRLRIKDIDFDNELIEIHQAKGGNSRIVPLPKHLVEPLGRLIKSRRVLHDQDLEDGVASVWLPHALAKKYPSAPREWRWQFLFASDRSPKARRSASARCSWKHWATGFFVAATPPRQSVFPNLISALPSAQKNCRPWGRRSAAGAAAFDGCGSQAGVSHGGGYRLQAPSQPSSRRPRK